MQKKKTEIAPEPAEANFYTEALKAFDAPVPQPKAEEPAPQSESESAPQEQKKKKINPWLIAGFCAIL